MTYNEYNQEKLLAILTLLTTTGLFIYIDYLPIHGALIPLSLLGFLFYRTNNDFNYKCDIQLATIQQQDKALEHGQTNLYKHQQQVCFLRDQAPGFILHTDSQFNLQAANQQFDEWINFETKGTEQTPLHPTRAILNSLALDIIVERRMEGKDYISFNKSYPVDGHDYELGETSITAIKNEAGKVEDYLIYIQAIQKTKSSVIGAEALMAC